MVPGCRPIYRENICMVLFDSNLCHMATFKGQIIVRVTYDMGSCYIRLTGGIRRIYLSLTKHTLHTQTQYSPLNTHYTHYTLKTQTHTYTHTGIFLSNFQGGAFEILDLFFKQISYLLKKMVDLSVCRRVQRSRYLN